MNQQHPSRPLDVLNVNKVAKINKNTDHRFIWRRFSSPLAAKWKQ